MMEAEMPRTIGRLESLFGTRCPNCGATEWGRFYERHVLRSWKEGSWWNRRSYEEVTQLHRQCGYEWTDVVDVSPQGGTWPASR